MNCIVTGKAYLPIWQSAVFQGPLCNCLPCKILVWWLTVLLLLSLCTYIASIILHDELHPSGTTTSSSKVYTLIIASSIAFFVSSIYNLVYCKSQITLVSTLTMTNWYENYLPFCNYAYCELYINFNGSSQMSPWGGGGGRVGGLGTTTGGATWSCVLSCSKHSKDKNMWFSVRNAPQPRSWWVSGGGFMELIASASLS